MSILERKTNGVKSSPYSVVIFGVPGVGKTGFASSFEKPIFIDLEGGSGHYNVDRVTNLSWLEVIQLLTELKESEYKTVVIDSLDWLERLSHEHICKTQKVAAIEDSFGSYGKWVGGVIKEWSPVITLLRELRDMGKNVVMVGHSHIKVFNDPSTALPYDRFVLKMNDKLSSVLTEWVDCVLFANFETYSVSKDSKAVKGKGFSTGIRKLYCEKRAAYDAKNRFGLPESINLDYEEFIRLATVIKPDLKKEIESLMLDIQDADLLEKIKSSLVGADDNKLNQIKNRILVILQEK